MNFLGADDSHIILRIIYWKKETFHILICVLLHNNHFFLSEQRSQHELGRAAFVAFRQVVSLDLSQVGVATALAL